MTASTVTEKKRMAKHRDTAFAISEDVFDVHDIQGNILAGFNKDHQLLMALRLRDLVAARAWLRKVAVHISNMSEVENFNALFRERRARLAGKDPVGLVATWANIAFSYPGLIALTSDDEANAVPDTSFRAGMPARAAFLGDRAPDGKGRCDKGLEGRRHEQRSGCPSDRRKR